MVKFITDYVIIGFRIVLAALAAILIVNTVLGVLAKVSPQMNMFVVGFQLKIIVGLFVLLILTTILPTIAEFIINEMKLMLELMIKGLSGT